MLMKIFKGWVDSDTSGVPVQMRKWQEDEQPRVHRTETTLLTTSNSGRDQKIMVIVIYTPKTIAENYGTARE